MSYVVHAYGAEEISATGLLLATLLLDLSQIQATNAEYFIENSYLLLFGENGSDRSAGSSTMLLLLLVRREATAAEKFGEKSFVVVDMSRGGQGRVGVISDWDDSHDGALGGVGI